MEPAIRVLMVTSEWPTPQLPFQVPFLVRQVEFLRRAGIDVDIFSFRGARRPINYLKAWRRLRARLNGGRYDLVHAQFGQSALLAWPRRLPLVITFHGCDIQGVKRADGRLTLGGRLLQRLCQLMALRADAVILVSARMRRFLPSSVKAPVIPMGLDFDQVPAMPKGEARRRLGLPADERLALFVGSPTEPVKRYYLARAAVDILNQTTPARLIVGWGMPPSQILLLMTACDALVMTSIQEGSPCVVKEALACNLPVVSLDVGDVRVRLNGISGCEVCLDERAETIAAALERILRSGQRIRGREAVKDLDEHFLTDQIVGIYRSVLKGKHHRRQAARKTQSATTAF